MGLIHTAIAISDLDSTLDFYAELGLERTNQFELNGVKNVYLGSDDTDMELQLKYDSTSTARIEPSGIDHIAIEVADVDRIFEELVEAESPVVVNPPVDIEAVNARAAFVEDPDGYVVELVEFED
ncbi:VOC family protein [Haloferax mediterranei ATCC 33500]|uniref:Lactoyglutathione lyase n=1 Tax=Haloferax mediterranei (strain ATCC 33500 / DSM 1411 / JCM 8866 / NBRC 14739 / NCIMB 2177 / R-4) TaxID=523841 RepID=I3R147_HALMT|nr:VOC family protein [Haloferax mediterranei]AFK17957.1 putative lactoyglutathione lyase [Haloferax mediterranei ATCC 33500]AHZ22621.1 lactoylglutathione lyase [Haloferax mediterranei ATCC 33500]EMA02765.1 putative lactoyglutathione lyase [Haloferax mediterranei ATCC 33500]MDX5988050.1 VOC family protein [Haloferax mediterranei ATCC 33500]QCQ74509.1 VOC family protein [Haloferax mediterranei ATCC 33500]